MVQNTELRSRALIGDLLNMSSDCIENLRPRAQYMHFYRAHYKKVKELLREGFWETDINSGFKRILIGILEVYYDSPIPTKENSIELSKKHLKLLIGYGYSPVRELPEGWDD